MKKLYNKKGKVHPSPDPFALLPAAILTLTAALSVQDREVLAYLISSSTSNKPRVSCGKDHSTPPSQCDCFRCYTSFWARWDASPNRQLIHEIIEAYEEKISEENNNNKKKKKKNSKVKKMRKNKVADQEEEKGYNGNISDDLPIIKEDTINHDQEVDVEKRDGDEDEDEDEDEEEEEEGFERGSSSMRSKIVSFLWGVWN